VKPQKFLDVIPLIIGNSFAGNNGKELDNGFQKFFTHGAGYEIWRAWFWLKIAIKMQILTILSILRI
jgi:hypothetical protein